MACLHRLAHFVPLHCYTATYPCWTRTRTKTHKHTYSHDHHTYGTHRLLSVRFLKRRPCMSAALPFSSFFFLHPTKSICFFYCFSFFSVRVCLYGYVCSPDVETRNAYVPLGPRDTFPFVEASRRHLASSRGMFFNLEVSLMIGCCFFTGERTNRMSNCAFGGHVVTFLHCILSVEGLQLLH